MNIQNAFQAYGVNPGRDNHPVGKNGLEEALAKIGTKPDEKKVTFAQTTEAFFEELPTDADSAIVSENYSKSSGQNVKETEENSSEAEKNDNRLENTSNRMSASDMEELINEGLDVFAMTAEELEAAMERLKLRRDLTAAAIDAQIENKVEDRVAIIAAAVKDLSNNPNAERIAEKLINANLPVTKTNLEKLANALELAGTKTSVTKDEAEYLLRNRLAPTLENIAEARSRASFQKKEHTLTDAAWSQLEPTVSHLLFQAGLRGSKELITAAQDFIKKDIPLTAENLKAYSQIVKIKLSDEDVLSRACDAISVGKDPKSVNLLSHTEKQVRQLIDRTHEITDEAIDYAVAKSGSRTGDYSADKIDLSLSELSTAQDEVSENNVVPSVLEDYLESGAGQAASIKARRQLEEIKAKMTYEAGFRLAKEGIRIDSVSMNRLINDLKTLENRFYNNLFTEAGVAKGHYTEADINLLKDTTEKLKEIEHMPASIVYDTSSRMNTITVNELHEFGMNRAFGKFNQTLETVMTSPSAKYGDSIEKAFDSADVLLKANDVQVTDASRRAVRILGYASAEIDKANIEKVSEYDEKLQTLFQTLKPNITVRLIRDGINPLNLPIDELNEKIRQVTEAEGIATEDSYAKFLVNLDQKQEIKPEEREAYLAIYRALHKIQDSEEAAVGNVFKAGTEPTLKALLTAVRSGKIVGQEHLINDTFQNLTKLSTDVDRIENKIKAGIAEKSGSDFETVNKLAETADNTIRELSEDSHLTAEEWLNRLSDISANGSNATRFLEDFNILTSIENIEAAKDFLNNDMTIFKDRRRFRLLATGEDTTFPDLTEHLNSKEEMQEAYAELAAESKEIKKTVREEASLSKLDVKALKKMDVGIRFMNRLAKREFYQIPVDTGDEIVNMNVTIISNNENEKAKVLVRMPSETLGTVNVEASLEEGLMKCFITSDNVSGMKQLKERQLNLFAQLAQNGIRIGSIFYGTEEVPPEKYSYKTDGLYKDLDPKDDSAQGSTNNELYRIAKAFVTHIREA